MTAPRFTSPAFRLVRTLDLEIEEGGRKKPVRTEIFQDQSHRTHFRYRLWGLEWFRLSTKDHPEPLLHEVLTTFSLPNLGAGDYFEAPDLDAAEQKFFDDFAKEFARKG